MVGVLCFLITSEERDREVSYSPTTHPDEAIVAALGDSCERNEILDAFHPPTPPQAGGNQIQVSRMTILKPILSNAQKKDD
jgi:hypothetical protein